MRKSVLTATVDLFDVAAAALARTEYAAVWAGLTATCAATRGARRVAARTAERATKEAMVVVGRAGERRVKRISLLK